MSGEILGAIRASSQNLSNAILHSVTVERASRTVTVDLVTDRTFGENDKSAALSAVKPFVPEYFNCNLNIIKLSPDCEMVKRKIEEALSVNFKAVYVTLKEGDITVEKTDYGFYYTVAIMQFMQTGQEVTKRINEYLSTNFCGEFRGACVTSQRSVEDITVEEKPDEIDFEIPVRTFEIDGFKFLEGTKKHAKAVYLADLNFASNEVVVCGVIEQINEREYTNKKGVQKPYLSLVISDTTAAVHITYFIRQKSYDKIKQLKVGDSIVCCGSNEMFNGSLRYTADVIDYGKYPNGFVPQKRASKPVPKYYHYVKPQPYFNIEQTDLFKTDVIPECLKNNTFVVLDLETTGLNSSPISGSMDRIIEIGAYKIADGKISESFSTFINPQKKLSDEITRLTGINEDMVADAPTYEQALPDFYKFCSGSILVGHNIVGFDFKFVDYYCSLLGYILDRKMIDTIPLSQELLFLSNYKLNTVADKFNITFNHHRAIDDALATAKIFIELIKIKKSLPRLG